MLTTPASIFASLKKVAPHISFSVERTEDPSFRWDGDGPDPTEEGYIAYDVDVYAKAIEDGDLVEGRASMGGHYDQPDKFDRDIGGYLPQMLEEAVEELKELVSAPNRVQAIAAAKYLKEVMHARHEEQREEDYKRRFRKKRWTP